MNLNKCLLKQTTVFLNKIADGLVVTSRITELEN